MQGGPRQDCDDRALRARLDALLRADAARMDALRQVRALDLPDCWIGAGFVRNAAWDHLHDRPPSIRSDIDVVWFHPARANAGTDGSFVEHLSAAGPRLCWSVHNQARMHERNGDRPYRSVADAVCFWPETATAIAARLDDDGTLHLLAPFGLQDLFGLVLRPTLTFTGDRSAVFETRVWEKNWLEHWPRLRQVLPGAARRPELV